MTVADLVVDLIVVDSLGADSTAGRDLEIGQASPTAAVALAALPEEAFAAAEEASMEAVASTEVAAVSMAVVVVVDSTAVAAVDSTAVAADMAVATGN